MEFVLTILDYAVPLDFALVQVQAHASLLALSGPRAVRRPSGMLALLPRLASSVSRNFAQS